MKEYTFEGRNEEEALQNACAELGVLPEDLQYEVVSKKSGVLGFGRSQVKLTVRFRSDLTGSDEPDTPDATPEAPQPAADADTSAIDDDATVSDVDGDADEGSDDELEEDLGEDVEEELEEDSEDLSERAFRARDVAMRFVEGMGLTGRGTLSEDERSINLKLVTSDDNLVIGRGGVVLDAIQFLVNKIVNRFPEDRKFVVVDVNNYRARKQDSLERFAVDMCERVLENGKAQRLRDLNPRERRFVHMIVSRYDDLASRSEGSGDRRVLLIEET